MAATDKSRQTSLASTRTPNTNRCPQIHGSFISADCRERFHPKDNFRHLPMTIRLNIPTIQALESQKITTNNPTTTEKDQQQQLQTLVSFVNPNIISLQQWNLPVAISPSPDIRDKQSLPLQIPSPDIIKVIQHNTVQAHNEQLQIVAATINTSSQPTTNNPTTTEKDQQQQLQTLVSFVNPNIISLQQWNLPVAISPSPDIRDKQSLPLQIPSPVCFFEISQILKHPRNVPQIRNKSSESYNSTSELPNDPKTFLFVSTTSLCRFSALCPLTDLLQPRYHEDHNPTAPSPIPL